MDFAGINYVAVVVACIASYAFGAAYYMTLAKPWTEAAGMTDIDINGADGKGPSPIPFIVSFVAQVFMAWVLAGLIGHLGSGQVTLFNGVISGLFVWAGFVVTTLATNHQFQNQKLALTLIDSGHWLGVLVIQGAIIGLFGI